VKQCNYIYSNSVNPFKPSDTKLLHFEAFRATGGLDQYGSERFARHTFARIRKNGGMKGL